MTKIIFTLVVFLLNVFTSQCEITQGRKGYGLIGYGIDMYDPLCAYSCRAVISSSALNCSTYEEMDMEGMSMKARDMSGMGASTSLDCYSTDDTFLQTLAWCVYTRCDETIPVYELETWWDKNVAGRNEVQPSPKETYQETLLKVTQPPTESLMNGDPLNKTSLVADSDYIENFNAQGQFETQEKIHEKYGLVLLLSGFVIPIGFSLLRFIPFPAFLVTKINSLFITPPLWGKYHKTTVAFNLVQVPTRGQGLFIFYLIAINVILSAVNISSLQPSSWYPNDSHDEVLDYVTNRVGVLSFANMPLVFLYAGRNNLLLWLTNWSHSTFLLLHRWIAYIATLQAIIHSLIWLQSDLKLDTYTSESKLPYWYWGIIATLSMSLLLPSSIIPIRQKIYEAFLLWHVALAVLTIAGCYLHIFYRFQLQWGYQNWILVTIAVWGFDRAMRVLRVARNGICTAQITPVDEDYIRIDIRGVSAGTGHAYLYFPTLTWKVWENHPFSVATTMLSATEDASAPKKSKDSDLEITGAQHADKNLKVSESTFSSKELSRSNSSNHSHLSPTLGFTFFVRTRSGLTSLFPTHGSVPVLVESMYGQHEGLTGYPSLVCLAGGVGVTAVLPFLQSHPGSKKLYWGVRNEGIVKALKHSLHGTDKEVFVRTRMSLREVLEDALAWASEDGLAVVVSGPATTADEVRMIVSEMGRRGGRRNIKLVEESFAW